LSREGKDLVGTSGLSDNCSRRGCLCI
jgi:hypothetical protein